jgi:hypothetical protein
VLNEARAEATQMKLPEAQEIESLLSQFNTAPSPSPPKKNAPAP